MSEQVNDEGRRVALSTYAGPAGAEESRRRYQLTDMGIIDGPPALPGVVAGMRVDDLRALHLDIGLELYRLDVRSRRCNGERVEPPEAWAAHEGAVWDEAE